MSVLLIALYFVVAALAASAAAFLGRRPPGAVLAALALLPMLFFWQGIFRERTPIPVDHAMLLPPWNTLHAATRYNPNLNDVASQMVPWAKAVRMAWKEGSLPLRVRWSGSGMALAANPQSAAFSPLTFLMFPVPLARGFTLAAAVKLFLALLGTWLWLSELGISRTGAFFGALSFGFSLAMTPWILFPHTAVICFWPWALFAIERLGDETAASRATWVLTFVFLCWAAGGHPESAALGAVFTAFWLLGRLLLRDLPRPGRVVARVVLAASVALGLSAFLLVPQVLAIRASNRFPFAEDFNRRLPVSLLPHGPLWPSGVVTLFFPQALGDSIDSPPIKSGLANFPEMAVGYFGIIGWVVALAILRPGSKRNRGELSLLVPLLFGVACAVGQWPIHELLHRTPFLRLMFPLRFFLLVALAGSAIAAFELDRLREDLSHRRRSAWLVLAVPIGLAAFALGQFRWFRPAHEAVGGLPPQRAALALSLAALGLAAALLAIALWRPRAAVVTGCFLALAAVSTAELLYQGMRLYRYGSPGDLYPDTPMLAFLRSRPGPFRVVGEGAVLFPNSSIFAGVEDIRTHDPVERRDYVEFLDATCGYPPADYFKFVRDINASALDFLNVRFLVSTPGRASPGEKWRLVYSGQDGTVFENRDGLPRVFAPDAITLIAGREDRLGWNRNAFTSFGSPASAIASKKDWREHAFVLAHEAKGTANGRAQVTDYRESTNEASFRAHVSGEAAETFLVASFVQDGGWSARDEAGRPIAVALANGPFLALRVPRGDHRILLEYSPPGFRAGLWITVACLLAIAVRFSRKIASGEIARFVSLPWGRSRSPNRSFQKRWIWLGGAAAVLIAGLFTSRASSAGHLFRVPATPLDQTNDRLAPLWSFLVEVRDRVPEGASYTLVAPDRDDEMSLYMLSLGILYRQTALPSSYFGEARPEGARARYVLAYGGALRGTEGALPVFRARNGIVYARPRSR
jgi:hypothetical protein